MTDSSRRLGDQKQPPQAGNVVLFHRLRLKIQVEPYLMYIDQTGWEPADSDQLVGHLITVHRFDKLGSPETQTACYAEDGGTSLIEALGELAERMVAVHETARAARGLRGLAVPSAPLQLESATLEDEQGSFASSCSLWDGAARGRSAVTGVERNNAYWVLKQERMPFRSLQLETSQGLQARSA